MSQEIITKKLKSNSPQLDGPPCSRSLQDQFAEYAEVLNDIADILQLPTGVTSAEIVAACQRTRNIVIEECAVVIQTQDRETRYQWMPASHFGTMTQEMANRLRRVKSPENSGVTQHHPTMSQDKTEETCKTEDAVIEMIRSRGKVGRDKYRKSMDRKDLHPDEWVEHLQEELADALQYAERIKGSTRLLHEARDIMLTILHERHWECASEWVDRYHSQFFPPTNEKPH